MANFGGFNFTGFSGVNLKNTAAIRFVGDGGFVGTLAIRSSQDADRQYFLPDKSGTFPIMGTFKVDLALNATNIFSTIVTVSGIRLEDAVVVFPNRGADRANYNFVAAATYYTCIAANPRNGDIELIFHNPGNATAYVEQVWSYLAMR